MRKIKFFFSLRKERDWLEDMARQGWLLHNMTMGIIYHFKQVEPCEKVFEVERFAITDNPTIAGLTARSHAFDISSQFGWQRVTHDKDMNYYFVKDKAGDETDEFYEDVLSRRERAERYRKHYAMELPQQHIFFMLLLSFIYIIFFLLLGDIKNPAACLWIYILVTTLEILSIYGCIVIGHRCYTEFSMSRAEWEQYKKYSERKRFNKVQQLRSYLQEKSEFGLSLKGYEYGRFLFEEDTRRYNYFIDTKRCLKKRMKKDGLHFTEEKKDIQTQSLKWYELSIADAARYNLKPVAVIGKYLLIYKRPFSEQLLPWENGNENLWFNSPARAAILFYAGCLVFGFIVGFIWGMMGMIL